VRPKRRLALAVLLAAAGLAIVTYPFRATWWGGWIGAIAEAGVVGGLADWFAVTALFRRPLGLPIPHTGLIPRNWEMLATRVGTMVGDRVLTREYLAQELSKLDVAALIARAAEWASRRDLEEVTRMLGWVARELPSTAASEIVTRLQRLLVAQPLAPLVAAGLDLAREYGWVERASGALARALAEALERPDAQDAIAEMIDDLLQRYRERTAFYPRLALGLADLLGFIDRRRIVAALRSGLAEAGRDPDHPLRRQVVESVADLVVRLRTDPALIARVEGVKAELLRSSLVAELAEEAATAVRQNLLRDLARPKSEAVTWLADRLEQWREALVEDAALRVDIDQWVKARALELLDRHHSRIAALIEQGVRALGPEGAVRLIEEHAGDDLQYIRVNGTVVGGLAGGALYAMHLVLRLFYAGLRL